MKKTELPYTWRQLKLEDVIFDIQPGFAQAPSDSGSVAQIRTLNISPDGRLDLNGVKYVDPSIKEIGKYSLCYGDVIFNNTNSEEWVGKTAFYDSKESLVFSNHITRLRVDHEVILPEYLAKYLHFLWFTGYSKHKAKRWVSQAGVEQSELLMFPVSTPPLEEQKYIVEILQQADELRRLRQNSLEKAEKLASALFLEMFGDPITNLMGWKKKTLKSMGRVQTGNTPPRENKNYYGDYIEWIKTDNINTPSPFLTKAKEYLSEEGLKIGRVVEKNSLLVTCIAGSRSVIGNAAIADRRVAFNQQINSFSPNTGNIIFYYFLFLNSKQYIQGFSTDNMKGMISKSTFEKIELIFPPANLQDDFARKAQYCEYIRQECFENELNLEKIQTQLSNQAFSGVLTEKWRSTQSSLRPATVKPKTVASATLVVHGVSRPSKLPAKRGWLLGQLSHFQIRILEKVCEQSGYLTEEGLGDLINELPDDINHDQEQKVRKTLEQLVALGLIMKVSVQDKEGGFVTAYRALRKDDDSRGRDRDKLEVW